MIRVFAFVILTFFLLPAWGQRFNEKYYRARAAMENGNYKISINYIDSAINEAPNNPAFHILKGKILFQNLQFHKALESFKSAENIREGIASYWFARTYSMQKDTLNSLLELERHLKAPSKHTEAFILLDTAFNSIRNSKKWEQLWLTDWYNQNERLIADVEYEFRREQWDYAIDLLNQRIEGRRPRHQLLALRGQAYFKLGAYRAAEADFKEVLKRSRRNHEYMAWRAKTLNELKRYKQAIRMIDDAIAQSGGEPRYYLYRAGIFANSLNYNKVNEDLEYYLSFYPNDIDAMFLYANSLYLSNRYLNALLQLGKLIEKQPNNPNHYNLRAEIYMVSKNWEFAEIDFTKSVELNLANAELFLNRGICRINLNKKSEACSDFRRAIELGSFTAQEMVFKYCR